MIFALVLRETMRRGCIERCVYGASRIFRHKRGRMGGVSSDIVYLARGAREGKKQFLNIPWRATDMIVKEGFCKDICGWNFFARFEFFEQEWIVVLSESFFGIMSGVKFSAWCVEKLRGWGRSVLSVLALDWIKFDRRIEKDRPLNRRRKNFLWYILRFKANCFVCRKEIAFPYYI